jgi:hypothetical protein
MTIDERIQALTMNLELQSREGEAQRNRIEALTRLAEIDAENIRALARIAETNEHRITRRESGETN